MNRRRAMGLVLVLSGAVVQAAEVNRETLRRTAQAMQQRLADVGRELTAARGRWQALTDARNTTAAALELQQIEALKAERTRLHQVVREVYAALRAIN